MSTGRVVSPIRLAVSCICLASMFCAGAQAQQSAESELFATDASSQQGLSATLSDPQNQIDSLRAGHIVYRVKILDHTGEGISAQAMNNHAQVVGFHISADAQTYRAAIWNGRYATAWQIFAKPQSFAYDINDSGLIIGQAVMHNSPRAVLWRRFKLFELGELGGDVSSANALNPRGWIAGFSNTTGNLEAHATLWKGFKPIDLGTLPGGTAAIGRGLNDYGDVVGDSNSGAADPSTSFATLWKNGRVYNLGLAGGERSYAKAINNKGQIVGWRVQNVGPNPNLHAILWEHGNAHDLGTLGGSYSIAAAINQTGLIVGGSQNSRNQPRGALWYGSHILDINSLLAPGTKGIEVIDARDINDRGEILALANTPQGGKFVLLTPVRRDQ